MRGLGPDDLVLALVSGGGSALLTLPAPRLTLADKQAVNAALLRSGAPIGEMNVVRKHLSAIKGGRLAAAAHPARVVTLVISDVPGDDPAVIASGPTVPDASTFAEARAVLAKYGITGPRAVIEHLERAEDETPKPGDPRLAKASTIMVASPQLSLEAAAGVARRSGITPLILGDALEGEAREVGKVMAGIARQAALRGQPAPPPVVLLSGGETTVTVKGSGRGGRNVEFLLSLAVELDGLPGVFALAADTDGVDGAEEVAGAVVAPDTLARRGARDRRQGVPGRQRRPRLLRGAGRPGRHRPDPDQRQRLPRPPRPRTPGKGGRAGRDMTCAATATPRSSPPSAPRAQARRPSAAYSRPARMCSA